MENRMFSAFNSNHRSNIELLREAQQQKQQQQQQQQCRSGADTMDVDHDRGTPAGLMSKIVPTGESSTLFMSSSSSQQQHGAAAESELRMLQNMMGGTGAAALGSLVRSNSMLSDGRLGCSPTSSTSASDGGALLVVPGSYEGTPTVLSADHWRGPAGQSDTIVSSMYERFSARSLYNQSHLQDYHPSGLPLALLNGNMQRASGVPGEQESLMRMGARPPQQVSFTAAQLRELQHQALVLKYIMNGVNVPADLINPIRTSLAGLSPMAAGGQLHLANLPWGGFRLAGFGANADPEPGRCRRTDGKKWRCSKDVVPDQKYCERHLHRGRHRARSKPATVDGQQTGGISASSAHHGGSATIANLGSSVTLGTSRAPPAGIVNAVSAVGQQQQQQQQQQLTSRLGIFGPYSGTNSPSASGLSVGSSLTANQYNQLSSLHSSAGANALVSKDYRYNMGGMRSSDLDVGADQMLFAEATASSRVMGQDYQAEENQHGLNTCMLSSINNSCRSASMQNSRAPSPSPRSQHTLKSSSPSLMQYNNSPHIQTLLGQELNPLPAEANPDMALQSQQHLHSFLRGAFGSIDVASNVTHREPESQPLRHFFDDWPRPKDPSTISWSDIDDDQKPNRNSSTTQLSISIPISSPEFNAPSSPPGKLKLSPLKLSMSRAGEEDDIPLGVELGVGMGLCHNEDRQRRQHANWIPIAWETPAGGPLAEVLQSNTPRASRNSGLNLMTEGWEDSPARDSHTASPPRGT